MKRTEQPNVTTWADAYGTWHARVTYSRNAMTDAQVAIWREIEARQGQPAPIPHVTQSADDPQVWFEDDAPDMPRLAELLTEPSIWAER